MARCDFCFQDKSFLETPVPRIRVKVCKACNYKIQQVIGFLAHSGAGVYVQPELQPEEITPPSPPDKAKPSSKAPSSKKKARKKKDKAIPFPVID